MFSSFDVFAIVNEIKHDFDLMGMKVDKIYKIGDEVRIKLRGKGRKDLILKPGSAIYLTRYPKKAPLRPSGFAMQLRKYLSGLRILDIEQIDFDRIVKIKFGLFGEENIVKFYLILELFGHGNLILTDENLNIIGILQSRTWSTRSLKTRERYAPPPQMKSPFDVDVSELIDNKVEIVKNLATRMNIGGLYAEEICILAGIDKNDKNPDPAKVEQGIKKLVNLPKKPAIVANSIVPFELEVHKGKKRQEFKTLNDAADELYGKTELEKIVAVDVTKKKKTMEKLERIRESQKRTLEKYEKKQEISQRKGNLLFENYLLISELLNTFYTAVKKIGWSKVNEKIKDADARITKIIKKIDENTGKITIQLDETKIELDITKNINENAQVYYDTSKKMKNKIEGAKKAIAITKSKLEKTESQKTKVEKIKPRIHRKKEWYERYRWFVSSEGFLIVGGKDVRTNETLIKKHMDNADIYLHADTTGAPQVIVKNGKNAKDITFKEAGIFAVSFSRAWRMGISHLDAYWVYPEQVTKEPPSGEFLSRGAFFIKGKKNFLKKLPLEVGIGIYKEKIMCGPISAIKKQCKKNLEIIPGKASKEETAKRIKQLLGWENLDDIIQTLPSGGCNVKS
ncbi:MAG: ribosome rescue protein RqcH [Candidatus Methanofastidiosia archaeon]